MSNRDALQAWRHGRNHRSGNVSTDGTRLYSYNLAIGFTDSDGRKIAFTWKPKRSPGSVTTACHVNAAHRYADEIVPAPEGHGRGCSSYCEHYYGAAVDLARKRDTNVIRA